MHNTSIVVQPFIDCFGPHVTLPGFLTGMALGMYQMIKHMQMIDSKKVMVVFT
jgi:hypothetical protein